MPRQTKKLPKPLWTVVQHSAYGYKRDYQFKHGLESHLLELESQAVRVRSAGGLLFDDYIAAEDYCMDEMYPKGHDGLTPVALGDFSKKAFDGLRLYLPVQVLEVA